MRMLVLWVAASNQEADHKWRLTDDGVTLRAEPGLPDPELEVDRVIGILDPELASVRRLEIPARSSRQLSRALPFAFEEHLAATVESQHLVLNPGSRPGSPVRATAVGSAQLRERIDWLAERDIVLDALYVASELIEGSGDPDELQLMPSNGRWLHYGPTTSGTFPDAWWSFAVAEIQHSSASGICVRVCSGEKISDVRQAQLAAEDLPVRLVEEPMSAEDWLARAACAADGSGVLTGQFAPPRRDGNLLAPLRTAAAALALVALVLVGAEAARAWRTSLATAEIQLSAESLYRELYPEQQRVTDPVAEMRMRLGGSAGGAGEGAEAGFFELFAPAAGPLGEAGLDLQSINFNGSRGDALIEVLARSFADVDGLQEALERRNLRVDISSAEQEQQRIRARLRIAAEGSR